MDFAPSFFLLRQETLLVESSLAAGVTAVRNGTLMDRGKLYSGFFQLSIGMERLFKLILVIDFMVSNRLSRPTNKWLRDYGHDLVRLYDAASDLPVASGIIHSLEPGSVEAGILCFLSRFAKSSRYYNLNALTNASGGYDPLCDWGTMLQEAVERDVPQRQRERITQQSALMGERFGEHTSVVAHDLENRPLDLEALLREPALQQKATRYLVIRIFKILGPARRVLYNLGHRGYEVARAVGESRMHIPDMADMLVFLTADRSTILRKKRWP